MGHLQRPPRPLRRARSVGMFGSTRAWPTACRRTTYLHRHRSWPSPRRGYANAPNDGTQTLFFGKRGSQTFPGYALVDFGRAVLRSRCGRRVRPYLKFDIYNVFNNDKLIGHDVVVNADPNSPLDSLGRPTGYIQGARFGQATRNLDYPTWRPGFDGGRTFLMSFGLRF